MASQFSFSSNSTNSFLSAMSLFSVLNASLLISRIWARMSAVSWAAFPSDVSSSLVVPVANVIFEVSNLQSEGTTTSLRI